MKNNDDELKALKWAVISLSVACFVLGFNIAVLIFTIVNKLNG